MNKLFFLILVIISSSIYSNTKILKVKSDPWCPFACDQASENKGFVVELTKIIFEKHGYQIDYANTNFARALIDTRNGVNDAIAGCAKEDAPDFVFPEIPQSRTTYQYFSKSSSKFEYKNQKSIKDKKIAVINSYTYDEGTTKLIQDKNPSFLVVSGDDGLGQSIKMLDNNRVDALVESNEVFFNFLSEKKINPNQYKIAGTPKQIPQSIFICFSPKNKMAKEWSNWMKVGQEELKKSGELKKLLNKYKMK